MKRLRPFRLALALVLAASAAQAADYPPPVQALVEQGVEIGAEFDAPGGLTGYVGRIQGRPLALYVTEDGQHVIIGSMLDAQGNNLTRTHVQKYLPRPEFSQAWPLLEDSTWISQGDADAERVVYAFMDPNCPYCRQFWHAAQEYVGDEVQVRYIMVAVLGSSSPGKAARILAAENQLEMLRKNETTGVEPLEEIPSALRQKIQANNRLMAQFGARGTPALFYKDDEGKVRRIVGLPSGERLASDVFQAQAE